MGEKAKVYFVRVEEETYKRIGAMADREMRSINAQANLLLKNSLDSAPMPGGVERDDMVDSAAYSIGVDHAKPGADKTVVIKPRAMGKTALAKKIVEQAQKKKKAPKGVEPVESCPHGYAKGNCKKENCNRRYRA